MRSSASSSPRLIPVRRPSVLAITSELPWPLDSGGHLRTFHLLRALATRFNVRLVTASSPNPEAVHALRQAGIHLRAVSVPARSRARELGRVALTALTGEPYVMYRRHRHAAMLSAVREEIQTTAPELFYLDHLDSLVFALECRGAPFVIDLHNVYSALLRRTANESFRGPLRLYLLREARLLEHMERRAARVASVVLASSRDDCDHFAGLGAAAVSLVPNGVDCGAYSRMPAGRHGGSPLLLYVGTMSWEPNARAAVFLADVVLPEVRKEFPDCRLRIVGRDPAASVQALAERPGIEVTGRVPNMNPHLAEAHILAVPLEAGGGTRLKILEAFAAGLPVVSTPVGCEGIEAQSGVHLVVAERADFANAVRRLLGESLASTRMATCARTLALEQYDWHSVGEIACDAADRLLNTGTERGTFSPP